MAVFKIKNCKNCKRAHEFLFTSPDLLELRRIKKLTGLSPRAFAEASDEGDPDATAALLLILHEREGVNLNFEDVNLDFEDLEVELDAEEQEKFDAAMKAAQDEAGKAIAAKATQSRK